jgi:hypothetical protein
VSGLWSAIGAFFAGLIAKLIDRANAPPKERTAPPQDHFDEVDKQVDKALADKTPLPVAVPSEPTKP